MLIDTHAHIDGEEFKDDLPEVIERAKAAGIGKIFVPAINLQGMDNLLAVCHKYPGYAYPMIGLHPEDVKDDYLEVIDKMKAMMTEEYIAIGEVGLDFYWSREYQQQQLAAFEAQVKWAVECQLPLMIHCRRHKTRWWQYCESMPTSYVEVCFIVSPATRKRQQNYWPSTVLCLA